MKNKLLQLLAIATLLASSFPVLPVVADGSGSITLSANKSSVPAGQTVVIAIHMNGGGTPIYGVESDLSYQSSKLQYVGFSATGSAFEISAVNGGSDGLATIARGTVNPVSGSALVGTATFRALASSGSATIAVAGQSSLAKGDGTPLPFSAGSVTVNLGGSAAVAPKTATPAAPAAPKDTTPPTISAIKVTNLTPFSATVAWTTNEPANSVVNFGIDTTYGLSSSSTALTTTHSVVLNNNFLQPEMTVHYKVQSADGSGNTATSPDQALQLPGVPVTIIVRGANGQPQAGATVTLDNATGTTNDKGEVTLQSGLGDKKVTTSFNGITITRPITVAKSDKTLPPFELSMARQPLNPWMLLSIGLTVVVLTLLGIDAVLFGSHFFRRFSGLHKLELAVLHRPEPHEIPAAKPLMSPTLSATAPKPAPSAPASTEAAEDELPPVVAALAPDPAPEPELTVPELPKPEPAPAPKPQPISHFTPRTSVPPLQSLNDVVLAPAPEQPAAPSVTKIAVTESVEQPKPAKAKTIHKPKTTKPRTKKPKTP